MRTHFKQMEFIKYDKFQILHERFEGLERII